MSQEYDFLSHMSDDDFKRHLESHITIRQLLREQAGIQLPTQAKCVSIHQQAEIMAGLVPFLFIREVELDNLPLIDELNNDKLYVWMVNRPETLLYMPKQKQYTINKIVITQQDINASLVNPNKCPFQKDRRFMIAICSTLQKKDFFTWVKIQIEKFKSKHPSEWDNIPKTQKFIDIMETEIEDNYLDLDNLKDERELQKFKKLLDTNVLQKVEEAHIKWDEDENKTQEKREFEKIPEAIINIDQIQPTQVNKSNKRYKTKEDFHTFKITKRDLENLENNNYKPSENLENNNYKTPETLNRQPLAQENNDKERNLNNNNNIHEIDNIKEELPKDDDNQTQRDDEINISNNTIKSEVGIDITTSLIDDDIKNIMTNQKSKKNINEQQNINNKRKLKNIDNNNNNSLDRLETCIATLCSKFNGFEEKLDSINNRVKKNENHITTLIKYNKNYIYNKKKNDNSQNEINKTNGMNNNNKK